MGLFSLIYALASNGDKKLDFFYIISSLISFAFLVLLALELVDQTICYKLHPTGSKSNRLHVAIFKFFFL